MSACRTSAWNSRRAVGEELQTEYLVPRQHAVAALRAINGLRDRLAPLLQISEVRTVAADDLWMSPCYRQACVGIHFTWKKDWGAVRRVLPLIEERAGAARCAPALGQALYDARRASAISSTRSWPDFQRLLRPMIRRANSAMRSWIGISLGYKSFMGPHSWPDLEQPIPWVQLLGVALVGHQDAQPPGGRGCSGRASG